MGDFKIEIDQAYLKINSWLISFQQKYGHKTKTYRRIESGNCLDSD